MLPRHGEPFQIANKCSFQLHKIMYLMHSSLLSTIYCSVYFSFRMTIFLGLNTFWATYLLSLYSCLYFVLFSTFEEIFFKFTFDFIFYNFHFVFLPLQIFISISHFYFLKFFYFNQFHLYLYLHFNLVSPYDFPVLRLRKGHLTFY